GRQMSLVRLHLISNKSDWHTRVWLPFEQYNDMFADQGPRWVKVNVPDAGAMSFMYGRMPRPLPGPVALEQMHVDFYPGRTRPSAWMSFIGWEVPESLQVRAGKAFLKEAAGIGPGTVLQSGEASGHLAFWIRGVGKRVGVMTLGLGFALVTIGM